MDELPYVDKDYFDRKVAEFAETNFVLNCLFNNPKSNIKTWEDLPAQLIQQLFTELGCKPSMQKY
jgi:hypothetical protein